MIKNTLYTFVLFFVLLICLEFFLRGYLGFCDAVLMREDNKYEYIAKPNQDRYRLRNHISYNNFSMRSSPIDTTSRIILGLGDSVINGGSQNDQADIATTLLSDYLSQANNETYQVLNIAGFSWGPDNCAAFINKHGHFSAEIAFLVVSSHDAYDNMDFNQVVGVHPNFPDQQYEFAIVELFDRYIIPRVFTPNTESTQTGINKKGNGFNTGFEELKNYFSKNNIIFFIYLHPEISEINSGKYNKQGEQIIKFSKENNINIILSLNAFEIKDYRDQIHLNKQGQKKMAGLLLKEIEIHMSQNNLIPSNQDKIYGKLESYP